MKVINVKIKELKEAEYNPRQISEDAFAQLKTSLEKFECVEPAVVNNNPDRTNVIVGGHQRIKAAKALGWKEFPCVYVKLTPEQEKELNIRLNKNTGEFDFDILANEFEIDDLLDWGFTTDELDLDIGDTDLPELEDGDKDPYQQITFTLHDNQAELIKSALAQKKEGGEDIDAEANYGNENSNANAIYGIVKEWLDTQQRT